MDPFQFLSPKAGATCMLRNPRPSKRTGAATVEFAIILALILVPALVGIWEMGRMSEVQQIVSNAARDGARRGASAQLSTKATAKVVTDYLARANIPTSNAQVTIANVTSGGSVTYNGANNVSGGSDFDLKEADQNDRLDITVTIPFNDFRWATVSRMFASSSLMGKSTWYALKDRDFPGLGEPPIE
jgi:Flp pilus assembly protein TadG